MDIVEFAERMYGQKLSHIQQEILRKVEEAERTGQRLIVYGGMRSGKTIVNNAAKAWNRMTK